MPVVVDASVAAKWLLRDEASKAADSVLAAVSHDGAVVPAIFSFEIENILLVAERRRRIDIVDVEAALTLLRRLAVDIDPAPMRSLGRTFDSARQFGLSAYDAAYVELAGRLRTTLFTADARVAHAARERKIVTVLVA